MFRNALLLCCLALCFSCSPRNVDWNNPKHVTTQQKKFHKRPFDELLKITPIHYRSLLANQEEWRVKLQEQHPDFKDLPFTFWFEKYGAFNVKWLLTDDILDKELLQEKFLEVPRDSWSLGNYLEQFHQSGLEILLEENFISFNELDCAWDREKQSIKTLDFIAAWKTLQKHLNNAQTIRFLKKEALFDSPIALWNEIGIEAGYTLFIQNKSLANCIKTLSPPPLIFENGSIPALSAFQSLSEEFHQEQNHFKEASDKERQYFDDQKKASKSHYQESIAIITAKERSQREFYEKRRSEIQNEYETSLRYQTDPDMTLSERIAVETSLRNEKNRRLGDLDKTYHNNWIDSLLAHQQKQMAESNYNRTVQHLESQYSRRSDDMERHHQEKLLFLEKRWKDILSTTAKKN